MLTSYLFTSVRNFSRQPVVSAIKILSLALGISASTLIAMHLHFVNGSNKYIEDWQDTYRLVSHLIIPETNQPYRIRVTPDAIAPNLLLDFADQIEKIARVRFSTGDFLRNGQSLSNEFLFMEQDAIEILDLKFIKGDSNSALMAPNSMIMSESAARKYFDDQSAIGQILTLNDIEMRVTGIVRDQPESATHAVEIALSSDTGRQMFGPNFMSAGGNWMQFSGTQTFVKLAAGESSKVFNGNLADFLNRRMPDNSRALADSQGLGLSLQPVDDIYLNPLDNDFAQTENSSRRMTLFGLTLFACLILGASCVNYMNLAISSVGSRSKEVSVRRTLGATRGDVLVQFLFESLLCTSLAILLALSIVAEAVPVYTTMTSAAFTFTDIFTTSVTPIIAMLAIAVGLMAGTLPAIAHARSEPVRSVHSRIATKRTRTLAKSSVTAAQFTVSTVLILLSLAIYFQTRHLQEMDSGFAKDELIVLDTRYNARDSDAFNYDAMLSEMARHVGVKSLAVSNFLPPESIDLSQFHLATSSPDSTIGAGFIQVGVGFVETYGFELLAGRTFSEEFSADFISLTTPPEPARNYGIIITDRFAERLGIQSPEQAVGEIVMLSNISFQVIGVVKQFRTVNDIGSDNRAIGIMMGTRDPLEVFHIRIDPALTGEALNHIDEVWASHRPGVQITRSFYAQILNDAIRVRSESLTLAALIASAITVLIAAFGMFALAYYSTTKRTKEVGIRKILGARAISIVLLLTWDFLRPVLVSCLVAWPFAYLLIDMFYAGFSSQAIFSIANYVLVTLVMILLAILTVVIQCARIANLNPVLSLRYE
ncbi:MAG: ABC transporter permease [Gammaproteobacteria bacterium]|nr:ABC transporter permease [Gammaproteobacteria bacterium]